MIYPNTYDGYQNHPENEFVARNFNKAENYLIQEMSDSLRDAFSEKLDEPMGVHFDAIAWADTIAVKFRVYHGSNRRTAKKFEALLDRQTGVWTTDEPELKLNELFLQHGSEDH